MQQIINTILITMLLSSIINYLFKVNPLTSLNCGIFAWVGADKSMFDSLMFNILGVYNDNRGGDSCGVYYDKHWIKGIGKFARYEALVAESKLHTKLRLEKAPLIIGHCRKASVGSVHEDNIQPVILKDNKGKVAYVQAHNGTLSNYRDLAKKYGIGVETNESDSSVLSKLIYKKGFDILREYEGTAALLMHFVKEPNTLYAFHGKSMKYSYSSEERPLHFWNTSTGTYISSEKPPLAFISEGDDSIAEFKYNVLYKIEGNKVEEMKVINREEKVKKEEKHSQKTIGFNHWKDNEDYYKTTTIPDRNVCNLEIGHCSYRKDDAVVAYNRGRYYVGVNLAHGDYNVDSWGWIGKNFKPDAPNRYHLWFFQGLLLTCKDGYDALMAHAKKTNIRVEQSLSGYDNIKSFEPLLKAYSVYPFSRMADGKSGFMVGSDVMPSDNKADFYRGDFNPLFSDVTLYFAGGDYTGKSKNVTRGMYTIKDLMIDHTELYMFGFGELVENKGLNDCVKCNRPANECKSCLEKEERAEKEVPNKMLNISCSAAYPKDCDRYGNEDGSCDTCSYNDNVDQDKQEEVYLVHVIATQLDAIVGDLGDLITEVEQSGYQHTVDKQLNVLTKSKENLKSILS